MDQDPIVNAPLQIGDGRIDVLEVKHGLPFRLILADAPDPAA